MANEAVLLFETHVPIPFTVADGTAIEYGTMLKLTDPFTAAAASARGDMVAGIAAAEKIADDGETKLAVYRGGIFKVTASGSIAVGAPVVLAGINGTNEVETAATNDESIFGIALETATDTQTLAVELRPTAMQLA